MHIFGAQMAEVAVDADLGLMRVRRMVGVFAPGGYSTGIPLTPSSWA